MTREQARKEIESIAHGCTREVNGHQVTRWQGRYGVDGCGGASLDVIEAAVRVADTARDVLANMDMSSE